MTSNTLLIIIKFIIIIVMIMFSIASNRILTRMNEVERNYLKLYEALYDSKLYSELPEDVQIDLENVKTRILFINVVQDKYHRWFVIFTILTSLVISASLVFDVRRMRKK